MRDVIRPRRNRRRCRLEIWLAKRPPKRHRHRVFPTDESIFSLAAEGSSTLAADRLLLRSRVTSPLKNRVRNFRENASGRPVIFLRGSLEIAMGCEPRGYETVLGRRHFLQPDPIGFAAGDVNLYRYVRNNPINEIDPFGEGVGDCAAATAELAAAVAKLLKRLAENAVCPDPGHDKAIEDAKNRVANAQKKVTKQCTSKDTLAQLAVIGAAALIAKKVVGAALLATPAAPAGGLLLATP